MRPITQAKCGASCLAYNRGCFDGFGPMQSPNPVALAGQLWKSGTSRADFIPMRRGITGYDGAFRSVGDRVGKTAL